MRRLSLYIQSGISLPVALGFMCEDSVSHSVVFILNSLQETVVRGEPLSRGFAQFPKIFDRFTIGFIEAGELSGSLPETLRHLAEVLEKRRALTQKITGALAYPLVIVIGAIGMAIFLTLYIFPKILPVLEGFGTTLPLSTRVLLAIESCIQNDWIWIGMSLLCIGIGFGFALRNYVVRRGIERIVVHMPLVGLLYRDYSIAMMLRTLELLLSGGVRIITALALVRTALPGALYPESIAHIEKKVAGGQRLSNSLREYPRLFPLVVSQMIAAGETTGTLNENLHALARLYEDELDQLTKNLAVLIEPVLMITMGLLVGFVALAIITPIYGLTQNLNISS